MITECAALIKTHDYRPRRNPRLPEPSSFLAKKRLPMRFSYVYCHCCRNADYKPHRFFTSLSLNSCISRIPSSLNNTIFRMTLRNACLMHVTLVNSREEYFLKEYDRILVVNLYYIAVLCNWVVCLLSTFGECHRVINVNGNELINGQWIHIKPCVIPLMDRCSPLDQSLSTAFV